MAPMALPLSTLPLPYRLDDSMYGPVCITAFTEHRVELSGRDNYGQAAQRFADEISLMDDGKFVSEAVQVIYQSARTQNNPIADWHWQAHACWYEARRRGNEDLYQQAYDRARRQAGC